MNMIQEKVIDCKGLEQKIFTEVCKMGCEYFAEILSEIDIELHKTRNKSVYRDKGKRRTTLKTLMGEVEIWRHVYTFSDENGKNSAIYLLDKAMGREGFGLFSEKMIERIGASICEMTYRATANEISSLTGQTISHTAVWNVIQHLGERIDKVELDNAEKAVNHNGSGEVETKVLFEEQDGIWINLQGKDRKKTISGGRVDGCGFASQILRPDTFRLWLAIKYASQVSNENEALYRLRRLGSDR